MGGRNGVGLIFSNPPPPIPPLPPPPSPSSVSSVISEHKGRRMREGGSGREGRDTQEHPQDRSCERKKSENRQKSKVVGTEIFDSKKGNSMFPYFQGKKNRARRGSLRKGRF